MLPPKHILMIMIVALSMAYSTLGNECSAENEDCESHLQLVQMRAQSIYKEAADKKEAAQVVKGKKEDEQIVGASCGERYSYMCNRDCTSFSGEDRDKPLACWSPATAWCKLTKNSGAPEMLELPQKCMIERDLHAAAALLLQIQSASEESLNGNARYCYEAGHCSNKVLHANSTSEDIEKYCDAKYSAKDGHGIWRSVTINEVTQTSTSHAFGMLACALREYYLCDLTLCQNHFCTPENEATYGKLADEPFVNDAAIGTKHSTQC